MPTSTGLLVGCVKSELKRAIGNALQRQGVKLNSTQVEALRRLYVMGPTSAGKLACSLYYDAGAMTRLLDQLEKSGYIVRQPDPDDRRALRIELSDSGKQLGYQLVACSEQVLDKALGSLSERERDNLQRYLNQILTSLRQIT